MEFSADNLDVINIFKGIDLLPDHVTDGSGSRRPNLVLAERPDGNYDFVEEGYLEGRAGVGGSIVFGKLLEIEQLLIVVIVDQFVDHNNSITTFEYYTTLVKITCGFNSWNNIRRNDK